MTTAEIFWSAAYAAGERGLIALGFFIVAAASAAAVVAFAQAVRTARGGAR